eukprot:UN4420
MTASLHATVRGCMLTASLRQGAVQPLGRRPRERLVVHAEASTQRGKRVPELLQPLSGVLDDLRHQLAVERLEVGLHGEELPLQLEDAHRGIVGDLLGHLPEGGDLHLQVVAHGVLLEGLLDERLQLLPVELADRVRGVVLHKEGHLLGGGLQECGQRGCQECGESVKDSANV